MSRKNSDTRTRILEATWHLMERERGRKVSMGAIAEAAGVSRQALYLHFASRVELVSATVHYVDEVKGLGERLQRFHTATSGVELLEACVEVWGNYIPEIYGLAKALLETRDCDEAAAAAWNGCMGTLRDVCRQAIETLAGEGRLASEWPPDEATELLWTMVSLHNWEQLTIECGWSTERYVERMKRLLKRTFVVGEG
ncbi:TetR/AcrR family transcriptional regulator [Endothiovibrio diazotrophicus]